MSMCISTAQARTNSAPRALLDLCLSHLCEDIHAGARNHTHQNLTHRCRHWWWELCVWAWPFGHPPRKRWARTVLGSSGLVRDHSHSVLRLLCAAPTQSEQERGDPVWWLQGLCQLWIQHKAKLKTWRRWLKFSNGLDLLERKWMMNYGARVIGKNWLASEG